MNILNENYSQINFNKTIIQYLQLVFNINLLYKIIKKK